MFKQASKTIKIVYHRQGIHFESQTKVFQNTFFYLIKSFLTLSYFANYCYLKLFHLVLYHLMYVYYENYFKELFRFLDYGYKAKVKCKSICKNFLSLYNYNIALK